LALSTGDNHSGGGSGKLATFESIFGNKTSAFGGNISSHLLALVISFFVLEYGGDKTSVSVC
jgi:hypothetical protein